MSDVAAEVKVLKLENKEFSRVGRKVEGEENTKYTAPQITEFPDSDAETILAAALDVTKGDVAKIAEYFVTGANHHLRLEAGGYTPEEKAAKALMKSGLPFVKGKTLEEVVAFLKSQS